MSAHIMRAMSASRLCSWSIRPPCRMVTGPALLNGTELEMKPVAREIGIRYFSLPDGREKERLLTTTLNSSYAADISKMTQHQTMGYKVG